MTPRLWTRFAATALGLGALAACGSEKAPDAAVDTTAKVQGNDAAAGMSDDAIAAELKQTVRPKPGEYRSAVTLVDLQIPGIPARELAQMRDMMSRSMGKTQTYCLTKEEASKGFEEMARQSQESCRIESFEADGNRFSGRMSCNQEGSTGTMTMTGTGSETGSEMEMAMNMASPDLPEGKMAMTLRVKSTRTGDCKP